MVVQLSPTDVGIPIAFMRRMAPELARDIVLKLDGALNLALSYGLTEQQWEILKIWPAFRQMVQEANEELGGSAGTLERARRRAALAVAEGVVMDMAVISGDPKVSPRDRIAAANVLVEVGAVSAKQQQAAASTGGAGWGGPLIQIMMPNGAQLNISEAPVEPQVQVIEGEYQHLSAEQEEDA